MEKRGEESREELKKSVHQALYYHFSDYCDVTAAYFFRARLVPGPYTEAIEAAEAEDAYGLYRLSWPADEEAVREAERLSRLSGEDLDREAEACLKAAGWGKGKAGAAHLPSASRTRSKAGLFPARRDSDEPGGSRREAAGAFSFSGQSLKGTAGSRGKKRAGGV